MQVQKQKGKRNWKMWKMDMCRIVCKREKKKNSIVSVFVSCLLKLMKSVGKGLERTC